ncbi:hypothetical protein D0T66_15415 [Dysgonomonas sp. 25]|nr:hypothetical protein [Dysgonomonas sp. 25]
MDTRYGRFGRTHLFQ